MKKLTTLIAGATIAMTCGLSARAEELWIPHMMGGDYGIATGALPPSGLYFINTNALMNWHLYSGSRNTNTNVNIFLEVPTLFWSTPYKIFGAHYALSVSQPWTQIDVRPNNNSIGDIARSGLFNTIVSPIMLSWDLPRNLYFGAGLGVYIPNGNSTNPLTNPAGNLNGNNFWTLEPSLAVSWLHDGWNLSLKLYYDYNFKDRSIDYKSGNVLGTESTISKEIGRWNIGLSSYTQFQITNDTGTAVALLNGAYAAEKGNRAQAISVGPVVGYNFGPVSVSASYFDAIDAHNFVGGSFGYLRFTVPLK
jgi:hypothetical protein